MTWSNGCNNFTENYISMANVIAGAPFFFLTISLCVQMYYMAGKIRSWGGGAFLSIASLDFQRIVILTVF